MEAAYTSKDVLAQVNSKSAWLLGTFLLVLGTHLTIYLHDAEFNVPLPLSESSSQETFRTGKIESIDVSKSLRSKEVYLNKASVPTGKAGEKNAFTIPQNSLNKDALMQESPEQILALIKHYTRHIILRLVESGNLSLDTPISIYLPDSLLKEHRTTIRQLLIAIPDSSFTNITLPTQAGLQESSLSNSFQATLGMNTADAGNRGLTSDSTSLTFEESEKAYYLLGLIIGQVTGVPYTDFVEQHLLQPEGLSLNL